MKIKYPKNEIVWVRYISESSDPIYIITSKQIRDWYYLYKINSDGTLERIGRAKTPSELESKYVPKKNESGKRKSEKRRYWE